MHKLAKRLVSPDSGLVCPDHWSGPDWVYTDGPAVAEINAKAGFEPDPQQQLALDVIFAVNEGWLPAAFSFCVVCARQNLKTGLLKQAVIGWLAVTDEQKIVWSSHEMSTTLEAQNEIHDLLESSPALSRLLPAQKNRGKYADNGGERVELTTGQRVLFKARTQSGGRGLAGDKTILDEALFLKPVHTASLLPIMLARPSGQVLYASSPGLLESAVLRDVRDRGRAGSSPRMFYLEWGGHWRDCADPECAHPKDAEALGLDCAADDRELWALNNPTVSTGRITLERIADLRQELDPEDFIRECQGQWQDPEDGEDRRRVVPRSVWDGLVAEVPPAQDAPPAALAVDMSHDRVVAIAGCWLEDDRPYVELLAVDAVGDTSGAVSWLVERAGRRIPVVIDADSPAASMVPDLMARRVRVVVASVPEVGKACGGWVDDVLEGRLAHAGQGQVDEVLAVARKRYIGKAGRWVWDRSDPSKNVAPLAAVTLARYGAVTKRKPLQGASKGKVVVLS